MACLKEHGHVITRPLGSTQYLGVSWIGGHMTRNLELGDRVAEVPTDTEEVVFKRLGEANPSSETFLDYLTAYLPEEYEL